MDEILGASRASRDVNLDHAQMYELVADQSSVETNLGLSRYCGGPRKLVRWAELKADFVLTATFPFNFS